MFYAGKLNLNRLSSYLLLVSLFFIFHSVSLAHPLESSEGLKRFDKNASLIQPVDSKMNLHSLFDIKDSRIGDNILAQAIELAEMGGDIHTITGGTRSDKVIFSFFQPYRESKLEQSIELSFNKTTGFITQINSLYHLSSAYLSLEPIREQVFQAAISKYGAPLVMADLQAKTGMAKNKISLGDFIARLDAAKSGAIAYFNKMNISRSAKFSADDKGYALMHTGFDQCYLWPNESFSEILTFCGFAPKAANAASRGLEFSLHNFPLAEFINEQAKPSSETQPLTL